ncbi:MAG: 6-phosphofructokinase [Planctomycetia bacterium]|nr:6-phosphofructokinase [Planctomycetia bacterium]
MSLKSPQKTTSDVKKVGILFSGGPAPSANAVICSAAECFRRAGIQVYGFLNGYSHLVDFKPGDQLNENVDYLRLDKMNLEGRRTEGGILIGSARANPGKSMDKPEDLTNTEATAPMKRVYDALCSLDLDVLISIGGDDTLTTAAKFKLYQDTFPADARRIRVIHLPKTIDNDYEGIDFTFGFFTAVDFLSKQLRNLLFDAQATKCYYITQLMGRKAAWLSYGAAIAGEASLVIGLEDISDDLWSEEKTVNPKTGEVVTDENGVPRKRRIVLFDRLIGRIADTVEERIKQGKDYGVIAVAEGIGEYLPLEEIRCCVSDDEYRSLQPDTFGHFPVSQLKFSSRLGRLISAEIQKRGYRKIKMSGLQFGYECRCQAPCAFDVILGSQLGSGAYIALVEEGLNGVMVSVGKELGLEFAKFEDLINMSRLRAYQRPLRIGKGLHKLARYMEEWVEEK